MGVFQNAMFFLQETEEYSGLCEQERYRDGASMHGLPKGFASCHALILKGAEECLYRRFVSLFGHGVGIRIEKRFSAPRQRNDQRKFRNEFGQDPPHINSIKKFFKNFNQRVQKNTLCFLLNGQHVLYFVANLRLY